MLLLVPEPSSSWFKPGFNVFSAVLNSRRNGIRLNFTEMGLGVVFGLLMGIALGIMAWEWHIVCVEKSLHSNMQ